MGFLEKVEIQAARIVTKPRKLKLKPLPRVVRDKVKSGPASGASGEQVGFSQLTETRKLTPLIQKELQLTDPFDFNNETWLRFTRNVAPKLLVALMLDMNIVPTSKKNEFARFLKRKLSSLSK